MKIEKEFIPYEQALELKELGFNENCLARFDGSGFRMLPVYDPLKNNEVKESWFYVTPLYQQAFRWFREKYNLNGLVNHYPNIKQWGCSVHNLGWSGKELVEYLRKEDRSIKYDTYEEVELECLKKLIEIVKNK